VRPLQRDQQLASLHLKSASPAGAEPYLLRIVRHEPGDADSRLALAQILAGSGRLDEAARHAEQALATPTPARPAGESRSVASARVHELLGQIYAARGEPDRASAAYFSVLEQEPDNLATRAALAELLAGQGRFHEAAEQFSLAAAGQPDSTLQFNLAVALAAAGDEPAAIEAYRTALKLAPDDADALNNLAFLLLKHGEPREAEGLLRRAIELRPGFAQAQFNLAGAYELLGEWPRARDHFREAARLDPRYAAYLRRAIE